jgi:ABC-type glycerol-3-phosphate transport system substrate-binding protein
MDLTTILIGLTSTILGGAIVVLFQVWIEHTKETPHESLKAIQQRSSRSNLPNRDYIEFVGRQQSLKTAMRVLAQDHRIGVITIDGVGGIGKTTLALEIAHRCREKKKFEAIIWVSAKREVLTPKGIISRQQSFSNFDDLLSIAARVLHHPELLQAPPEEKLPTLQYIFSQESILLILDNLEVIEDARIDEFLRELPIPSKAIVTTRHRINVAYDIRLTGMSLEESMILMNQECEKKAVRLSDQNLQRLYYRTGGIPLAMVWCIAQVSGKGRPLSVVLDTLGKPHDDVCQFCFQESFKLLAVSEQKVLFALSLFDEAVNREIIGVVANVNDNMLIRDESLAKLVQLSLVTQTSDSFNMLTLTKLYTRTILEQTPVVEQEVKEKWVRYYIGRENTLIPITVYFPVNVPGQVQTCIHTMVQRFNDLSSGIYVIPIFTGEYVQTSKMLRHALAQGPLPDVAVLGIELWLEMVTQGILLSLNETIMPNGKEYFKESGFEESFLLNTEYQGQTYGLPFSRSFPVIYYNRDILETAGIDGLSNPPLTWDDLIGYAKQTRQSLKTDTFFPVGLPIQDWFLSCFTRQASGRVIDDDNFAPAFDSREAVQALEFWDSLCKLKLAKSDLPWFQGPQEFVQGRCAILYHTSGSLTFLSTNAEFEVGVWKLPYYSTPAAEIGGTNFAVLANRPREQQRAAWQFIDWFTQPEQSAEWAISTGYLPVRHNSLHLPVYMSYVKSQPGSEVAISQRDRAYPRTSAPYFAQLEPLLLQSITETLQGRQPPKEALAKVQDSARKLSTL